MSGKHGAGKGDRYRQVDQDKYRENYEKISDNLSLEEENLILELYHGMISEISQASGLTGHNIFPKASAEEEYEGYVERSRHQGLKNVYKRREMRIRVQKTNKKA